jgi:hypothetical protein
MRRVCCCNSGESNKVTQVVSPEPSEKRETPAKLQLIRASPESRNTRRDTTLRDKHAGRAILASISLGSSSSSRKLIVMNGSSSRAHGGKMCAAFNLANTDRVFSSAVSRAAKSWASPRGSRNSGTCNRLVSRAAETRSARR